MLRITMIHAIMRHGTTFAIYAIAIPVSIWDLFLYSIIHIVSIALVVPPQYDTKLESYWYNT